MGLDTGNQGVMPLIVNSPFSGRPVKIRDQDVGRAVRDEENRIFYAVERSDGKGYYGSPTRKGLAKNEQRYLEMETQTAQAKQVAQQAAAPVHNAMGTRKIISVWRRILVLWLLLIAAALLYFFLVLDGDVSRLPGLPHPPEDAPHKPLPAPAFQSNMYTSNAISPFATTPATKPFEAGAASDSSLKFITTASGLQYQINHEGDGPVAVAGSYVVIDYMTWLADGTQVDSTEQSGPIGFVLWSGQMIRGWDEGITGMHVGEKRTLISQPQLVHAAGPSSRTGQLANAVLRCEIELHEVLPGVSYRVDVPGKGLIARPGDMVAMHYVGYVAGQTAPFDRSHARGNGDPLSFRIGEGQMMAGWELGIAGMAEGEKRTLAIPSYLAYGQRSFGDVFDPETDLVYEIALVIVEQVQSDQVNPAY
jgi:FKBP-type peptidyl-prolyl cis-trans isomerase